MGFILDMLGFSKKGLDDKIKFDSGNAIFLRKQVQDNRELEEIREKLKPPIKTLTAKDFKITEDGEEMNVTKVTYNPFTKGYLLEWEPKKQE